MVSKKKACTVLSHSVVSDSLQPYGLLLSRLFCPWRFSRQEYWSGLPCPLPGDLPNPRIEPRSPTLQADSLMSEPPEKPMKSMYMCIYTHICVCMHIYIHTLNTSLLKLVKQTFTFSMLNQQHSETMKARY